MAHILIGRNFPVFYLFSRCYKRWLSIAELLLSDLCKVSGIPNIRRNLSLKGWSNWVTTPYTSGNILITRSIEPSKTMISMGIKQSRYYKLCVLIKWMIQCNNAFIEYGLARCYCLCSFGSLEAPLFVLSVKTLFLTLICYSTKNDMTHHIVSALQLNILRTWILSLEFNPLMHGGNKKKVTHTETNLKYSPFRYHQALKG